MAARNTSKTSDRAAARLQRERSAAVAATWTNKKVAKARATRHHVKAGGKTFTSLAQAFDHFEISRGKLNSARLTMVANGVVVVEGHRFTEVE